MGALSAAIIIGAPELVYNSRVLRQFAGLAFLLALARPAAPPPSFQDPDGLITEDFARVLESDLQSYDRATGGRFVLAVYRGAPPEGVESFTSARMREWTNLDPRLDRGVVLFFFQEPGRTRAEAGPGLARVLPDSEIRKILDWSMGSPGALVTYPQSLQKAVAAISYAAREALERPAPGAGLLTRLRFAPRQLSYRLHASRLGAGNDWLFVPIFGLILLGVVIAIVIGQIRMIGRTIASGRRRHESGGRIAAEVAGKLAVEGLEVAAEVAISAVGGSSGSGGSGFSGGGGSFGGGGASGNW